MVLASRSGSVSGKSPLAWPAARTRASGGVTVRSRARRAGREMAASTVPWPLSIVARAARRGS
jgi:hypothetical protein